MPSWTLNEFKHIGVDFSDPRQVETYEARQQTNVEAERALVSRLGIKPEHTVLEYGPGTGAFALAAGETGAAVIGVDISEAMLSFASRKAREAKLANVTFQKGAFLTHNQPDETVDYVVTKFALHHLPDFWKVAALRRIWKCLKPGGTFYLQDVVFSFKPDDHEVELEAWIDRATKGGSFSRADFEMHIRDEYSTYAILMENMLRLAGFRILTANRYSYVHAEYVCVKPET